MKPFPQIHHTAIAEVGDREPCHRVDLLEMVVGHEDEPPFGAVFALPVVHPPGRHPLQAVVDPQRLARLRVDRDDGVPSDPTVEDAAHHQGVEGRFGMGIDPGDLQLRDIRLVDDLRVEEARTGGVTPVRHPRFFAGLRRKPPQEDTSEPHC